VSGGVVFDGAGAEGRLADIGIKGDRIAAIGDLADTTVRERIDASGLAVAPGFIDAHTHSDLPALLAPFAENRLYGGVTTEIAGNCGFSAAPLAAGQGKQFLEHYEGLVVSWHSMGEYFDVLEKAGSSINRAFLVGFGNIRRAAMGGDVSRAPSASEMRAMRDLLVREVAAGAIGMSSGLIYPPGCYATKEEIAEVASAVKGRNLVYASHIRSEGDTLFEALDEAAFIAREGGLYLHVSHLKVNNQRNWSKHSSLRDWWRNRQSLCERVTADRYPYCAGHTGLDSVLPAWTYEGGPQEELRRLRDDSTWEIIRDEIIAAHPDESDWDSVGVGTISNAENKRFEGMRISAIARVMGLDPVDAIRALLIGDETRTMAMFFSMDEESMREIFTWDDVVVGSDSSSRSHEGPTAIGFPHPRTYGTTGKVFRELVRERKVLTLPQAIRRMTSDTAAIFGLEGRGTIERGAFADVVVFDPAAVADRATYESPSEYTVGVRDVLVNGKPVLRAGKVTGAKPGLVLKGGQ
jgi:N-acyl-D-amino-acid deacylase